jgi:hypothetical protein
MHCQLRLLRVKGLKVELRGVAAEQWHSAKKLRRKNPRIEGYFQDLLAWCQGPMAEEVASCEGCAFIDDGVNVQCGSYGSAEFLYYREGGSVVVFWLSGFFRPTVRPMHPHSADAELRHLTARLFPEGFLKPN